MIHSVDDDDAEAKAAKIKMMKSVGDSLKSPEEMKKLENEQWAWWFSDFSRGPSTIVISFFFPAVLLLAANDGTCLSYDGHSSGADDMACTPDDDFNYTHFISLNGSKCEVEEHLDTYFLHDPNIPGCAEAIDMYRETYPEYTCNCTGHYSYLKELGSIRVGTIQSLQAVVNTLILAFCMPLLGTYMDYSSRRKKMWAVFTVIDVIGSLIMAIIGPNYLWLVGMLFATITHVASDTLWVPISSFLGDVTHDDKVKAKLGGLRQFANFSAQCLFVVINAVLAIILDDVVLLGIIASVLDGLWLGFFMPFSLYYIRERKAAKQRGKKSIITITLSETWTTIRDMRKVTPEAFKYIFAEMFASNGITTVLAINVSYFTLEVGSTSMQIIIVSGVVLLVGIFCSYLFSVCSKYYSFKTLWSFTLLLWIALGIITPVFITRGVSFLLVVLIGGVGYSLGFSWYFSIAYPAFESMAPPDRRSQYTGIYTLASNLGSAIGPAVYTIIVQMTNSQRLAICTLPIFNAIALILIRNVDFDKAKRDAHREDVASLKDTGVLSKGIKRFSRILSRVSSTVVPTNDDEDE